MRIERVFTASRDRVFAAWTTEGVIRRWWAPGPHWTTPVVEVDPRVGGRLLVTMAAPAGTTHTFVGQFLEIRVPERIVYSSAWVDADGEDDGGTLTVTFHEAGDGTLVVLEFDADDEAAAGLEDGWAGCSTNLNRVLAD